MKENQKIVLGLIIVSLFVFLLTVFVFVTLLSQEGERLPSFLSVILKYRTEMILILGLLGVCFGYILHELTSTAVVSLQPATANAQSVVNFLDGNERRALEFIREQNGKTTQSAISKLPTMTRLRAHRIVKRLENYGLVIVERWGIVNRVSLIEEIKEK